MSAINGPDEHSHTEQYSEAPQQYSNATDNESEYDQSYEPEREFVLMPLFRRIGEILGLRRNHEPEYIYQPEQNTAAQEPASRTIEPREEIVLPETAIQYSEPQLPAENQPSSESPAEVAEQIQPVSREPVEEDVLQLESAEAQPAPERVLQQSPTDLQQLPTEAIYTEPQQDLAPAPVANEVSDEQLVSDRSEAPEVQPAHLSQEEWPTPPVQLATASAEASRKRNPDEIRQLVAPLREAAVKITAIVAQAAEWLRAKEEEFLRNVEVTPAKPKTEEEISSASKLVSPAEDLARENIWQQSEVPTLQREEAGPPTFERQPRPVPIQFVAKPDRPMPAPAVPFWKRINWAEEFTPKRVAFLGGLAMAVLLVLGISLARRPASSVLPEQQTRAIEPGGVTVTTHPVAAPVPSKVLRNTSASDRPAPVPQHRSRRASAEAYDDEPDVVVHHYDTAKKPSPVKQTTVAGVRHYSDM
jgi:hypothetical protein